MPQFVNPPVGQYKKFTKDLVILVLKDDFPLSLKQIKSIVTKSYGVSVTYQAIRKSVRLLQESGVLIEEDKRYSLNKDWILELENFTYDLRENYFSNKIASKESVGDITEYTFNNLIDLNKMWRDLHMRWLRNEKDSRPTTWWGDHCWWVLGQLNEEDTLLKEIRHRKAETYWLNNGNTFLDRWSEKYYADYAYCSYKMGDGQITGTHLVVFGDYILETRFPEKMKEEFASIYNNVHKLVDLDPKSLMKIIKGRTKIKLTVMKNKLFADQMRKRILEEFE